MQPIQEKERIVTLDIIRGFAIFGILLVNMLAFFSPFIYINPNEYWTHQTDIWALSFIDIFAQASFYTLFSFLFGYGFIIFTTRLQEKGLSVGKYFSRRLFVLLIIGCIHAFLIWHGDILILYALIGFLLIPFLKVSVKGLTWTAVLLLVIPNGLLALSYYIAVKLGMGYEFFDEMKPMVEQSIEVYKNGSYLEITAQRIHDWSFVNISNFIFIIFTLLPMFLLGAAAAKIKLVEKATEHLKLLKGLWVTTLIGTLVFKLLPYYTDKNLFTEIVQDFFGGPFHAIFYFTTITLLVKMNVAYSLLAPLRYIGRMSLSNYLLQSVVCTFIAYGYGLGYYDDLSVSFRIFLAIILFSVQIMLSKWWLSRFQYGPAEWIWRIGTYGTMQPIKKVMKG
ncbi:DUF418 domain-containing protein [Bacillus alkalisoli]|uniref:DUF418 domain-containing protein n=1 Tax=Bacillus alkalisoli TaxID=2011008 RepID=UPI000C23AA17|nr:DUF418 domain-containing protein [Bacillus alkalisoli]